jgi:hypothetical protein
VVDIVLGDGQLILSMLQPCTCVIKEVRLDVAAAIRPHQLIIQCLDKRLKMVVLQEELSVALLDVLDNVAMFPHPVVVLLQVQTPEGTGRYDLLKQGAHKLGIACCERPTHVVSLTLEVVKQGKALTPKCVALVPEGKQGNNGAIEARQVVLTKLHEGLGRWCSQNSMRAWWEPSPECHRGRHPHMVNQAVMLKSVG